MALVTASFNLLQLSVLFTAPFLSKRNALFLARICPGVLISIESGLAAVRMRVLGIEEEIDITLAS
jgi:hypothetical protein